MEVSPYCKFVLLPPLRVRPLKWNKFTPTVPTSPLKPSKIIFYQPSWWCILVTVKLTFRASALRQSKSLTICHSLWRRANARNISFETLYYGQLTLSTQLIKTNEISCYNCYSTSPRQSLRQNVFFCCRNHDSFERFRDELVRTDKGGNELVFPQVANLQIQ